MGKVNQRLAGLLVAGGRSERFGEGDPKQFRTLEGRMLMEYAAEVLHDSPLVHGIVVVVPAGREAAVRARLTGCGLASKLVDVVAGGDVRQESVRLGLRALRDFSHVLVHDAARPFLTPRLVRDTVAAVHEHGAATAALPVSDTLIRGEQDPDGTATTVDRDALWMVQTPQVFDLELLRQAHEHARRKGVEATDDGGLVLELGRRLDFVPGNWWNIKVTHPRDLERAACILKMRDLLLEEDGT